MKTPQPLRDRRTGSTVLTVVMITTAIGLVVASLFNYTVTEQRLNYAAESNLIAKQASEAAAEYGFAQLKERFDNQWSFATDELKPSNNPLELTDDFYNTYSKGTAGPASGMTLTLGDENSNRWGTYELIVPEGGFDETATWGSQDLELIGGVVETTGWTTVDPNVPGNENDPMKGNQVFERYVQVFAKAKISSVTGREQASYTTQTLQLRDSPLFAYAIFYNGLSMEIAPGPQMDIYGPVHANSDMYLKGNSRLNFHDSVTTAGDIFHGRDPAYRSDTDGRTIYIDDGSGTLVKMNSGVNSSMDDWRETASQLWNGQVQTREHGINEQNPVAVDEYVADTDPSTAAWDPLNYAYNLIQPVLNETTFALPDPDVDPEGYAEANQRRELEKEKFAYKAGLVLEYDGSSVSAYTYTRDADGDLTYAADGTPIRTTLNIDPADQFWTVDTSGAFTDPREGRAPDLVEIDVDMLRTLLDNNDEQEWGAASADSAAPEKPANFWNGVVYIQTPLDGSAPARDDWVTPADNTIAVRLQNGSTIPNPSFAVAEGNYGTTFSTNTYIYVQGNFNADGDPDTGSATLADDADTFAQTGQEAPAAIAADAINVLSNSWVDANSTNSLNDRRASFTEVSAAFLSGQVPSGFYGGSTYSGGVENFPRFLEKWSGVEFMLRGSLVALFNSEVAVERWGKGGVYGAPGRNWGFHAKFGSEGFYPPGTPNTRTYRRTRFTDLTEAEYIAEVNDLATTWSLTTDY
ncbi:MAG: hypothetical protein ACPGN3_00165 [Opitutales bacterium]